MFDDPMALRSDWHDSSALEKYFLSHQCVTTYFAGCLKHKISIQMSIQSKTEMTSDEYIYIYQKGNGYDVPKGISPHDYRYPRSLGGQTFNLVIRYKEPHNF